MSVTLDGMNGTCAADPANYPSCRGHGWKIRRSRRALIIGALTRGAAGTARRTCLDCGGSGQAAR
jgi:hypothetical protein